jgi:hypothetical protein
MGTTIPPPILNNTEWMILEQVAVNKDVEQMGCKRTGK